MKKHILHAYRDRTTRATTPKSRHLVPHPPSRYGRRKCVVTPQLDLFTTTLDDLKDLLPATKRIPE